MLTDKELKIKINMAFDKNPVLELARWLVHKGITQDRVNSLKNSMQDIHRIKLLNYMRDVEKGLL